MVRVDNSCLRRLIAKREEKVVSVHNTFGWWAYRGADIELRFLMRHQGLSSGSLVEELAEWLG